MDQKQPTHPRTQPSMRVIPGHEAAAAAALRSVAMVQGIDLSCFDDHTDEEVIQVVDAMLADHPATHKGELAFIGAWVRSLTKVQRRFDA